MSRYGVPPWKNYLTALFVIIIIWAILNRWVSILNTWYFPIPGKGRWPVLPGHQRYVTCHLESRDGFIGWNKETRTRNLHLLAYNSRFLIPNWVRVPHLASHLLGRCAKVISSDWEKLYNHPIYWLETFVDTERFEGTCYKSANWLYIGKTKGLGKNARTKIVNRSLKAVWGYPLHRNFRELLNHGNS